MDFGCIVANLLHKTYDKHFIIYNKMPRSSPNKNNISVIDSFNNIKTDVGINFPTIGLSTENVQSLIENPDIIRSVLIISAIAVYSICLILFLSSFEDAKTMISESFPGKVPAYIFNPIFVVIFLTCSIAGFIYIVIVMKFRQGYTTAIFAISSFVYLIGLSLCFARFYFNPSLDTSAPQIYSFMFVVSMVMISLILTQESNDFLFSLIAASPSLVFGCFYVYYGGKITN